MRYRLIPAHPNCLSRYVVAADDAQAVNMAQELAGQIGRQVLVVAHPFGGPVRELGLVGEPPEDKRGRR